MISIENLRTANIGDTVNIEINGLKVRVKVLPVPNILINPCSYCSLFKYCEGSNICTMLYRPDGKEVYFKFV